MAEKLGAGDLVVAVRPGGQDPQGFPRLVPEPGQVYRITSIYKMRYGLGCTLENMDSSTYLGFLLFVKPGQRPFRQGWYFKRAQLDHKPAEADWLTNLLRQKEMA